MWVVRGLNDRRRPYDAERERTDQRGDLELCGMELCFEASMEHSVLVERTCNCAAVEDYPASFQPPATDHTLD